MFRTSGDQNSGQLLMNVFLLDHERRVLIPYFHKDLELFCNEIVSDLLCTYDVHAYGIGFKHKRWSQ